MEKNSGILRKTKEIRRREGGKGIVTLGVASIYREKWGPRKRKEIREILE